jgi:lipopolysaccharide transport system permease protein
MAIADRTTIIIEARPKTLAARLQALWQYRAFYPFLFQEISLKKFRGTALGFWWLILRPLIPTAITIVVFTHMVRMESHGLPYAIFFLSGFMTWNVFQATLVFMPRTLMWMQGMMRRTYFPKLLVPLASIGPPLVELAVMLCLFVLTVGYFTFAGGGPPLRYGWAMLWLPVCLVLALLFAFAIGTVMSVTALFFRDVVFSVAYFAQLCMFLTPVIYPITFVPESYRWIVYALNPMAQMVEVSRWSLTGIGDFRAFYFLLSAATIVATAALSIGFFMRAEAYLADEI